MKNSISRRDFFKKTAVTGSGFALGNLLMMNRTLAFSRNYGDVFIQKGRETLCAVKSTEMEKIEQAAAKAAATLASGKNIYSEVTIGHMMFQETNNDRIGNPGIFKTLPREASNPPEVYQAMQPGDFFIANYPHQYCLDAHKRGVYVVGVTSPFVPDKNSGDYVNPWAEGYFMTQVSDLVIESYTPHSEGLVPIPEIPVAPVFPGSELTLSLIYWMLNAELADKIANGNSSKPLEKATEYYNIALQRYDEAARQIHTLKDAGANAAERILKGSKFYIYDKRNELVGEASGRASGLMLTNGIGPDLKTLKYGDILVIGAYSSDDKQDIDVAKRAREIGAWIVGIGPTGTEGDTSGERTLKLVDVPLDNRSPDQWGCIPIQGRAEKICPTSGITNAMLFWSFQAHMTGEMIERGAVPYIWMGFHLKGGREYDNAMRPFFMKRGY